MATPVSITSNSSSNIGSSTSSTSNTSNSSAVKAGAADKAADMSPVAKAKAQLNASIVEASLTVSLNSSNNPMSVVFKTALTGINEALKADFGEDAIQHASSQDNSPEATASRIVSLSTAFYDAYKQQHPGQDEETTLNNFMSTVQKGVEQGFKEARGILQGFNVLNGNVATNIDKTYDLIQQGFADFVAARKAPAAETSTAASAGSASAGASAGTGAATVTVNATVTPKLADNDNAFQIDPPAV